MAGRNKAKLEEIKQELSKIDPSIIEVCDGCVCVCGLCVCCVYVLCVCVLGGAADGVVL